MASPLAARLTKLLGQARTMAATPSPDSARHALERYRDTPVRYMREVLGLDPWEKQQEAAMRLLAPPYRVQLKACHKVGKSWLSAALISWWYDTRPHDSAVLTTAPTKQHVTDVLWREVRSQRRRAGLPCDFHGDVSPVMSDGDDHVAKGITAKSGEAFQGRHFRHMLFIFDEAIGVDRVFWEVTSTMFKGGAGEHAWLCVYNPTDTSSQAYAEDHSFDLEGGPAWHTVSMSAFEHPNIVAELAGENPPYPAAISLEQVDRWVSRWCDPIGADEVDASQGDFAWRPGTATYFRPGPQFDSRAAGRWPRQDSSAVWSELAWAMVTAVREPSIGSGELPVVGADLASSPGGDFTEIHSRWGTHSLAHERHNGWLEDRTAKRLKEICGSLAAQANARAPVGKAPVRPQDIPVHYDGDGRGGALATHKGDYKFIPVCASSAARAGNDYPNRRSELWFDTVLAARQGRVNISRLDRDTQARLRQEAMSPTWRLDAGLEVVEKKDITRKRLGRSPDGMDALNLAYIRPIDFQTPSSAPAPEVQREGWRMGGEDMARRQRGRGLFGR